MEKVRPVFFISGHRDATWEEFNQHYRDTILAAIKQDGVFVVGDCDGIDSMAQDFLYKQGVEDVFVFHIGEKPQYCACDDFIRMGEFPDDISRDWQMTLNSHSDILWIRKGKERSGTGQNAQRRKWKEEGVTDLDEVYRRDAEMFL